MFTGSLVNCVAKNKFELLILSAGITGMGHYTQHPGVFIFETDGISSYGFDSPAYAGLQVPLRLRHHLKPHMCFFSRKKEGLGEREKEGK